MEEYKLFDAEYRLMELVWNLEPVNSTALARRCEAELCRSYLAAHYPGVRPEEVAVYEDEGFSG